MPVHTIKPDGVFTLEVAHPIGREALTVINFSQLTCLVENIGDLTSLEVSEGS